MIHTVNSTCIDVSGRGKINQYKKRNLRRDKEKNEVIPKKKR